MAKSISVIRKKRGRPATGTDPLVALRLPPDLKQRIDQWAEANGEETRSETMRRLLERGLTAPAKIPLIIASGDRQETKKRTRLAAKRSRSK